MVSLRIGALKMERVQVKSEEFKEQKEEYRHDRETIGGDVKRSGDAEVKYRPDIPTIGAIWGRRN